VEGGWYEAFDNERPVAVERGGDVLEATDLVVLRQKEE
jgi:hypothetical protein